MINFNNINSIKYLKNMEYKEDDSYFFCDLKEIFLNALNSLENIQKIILLNNNIVKIVLEETIAENWIQIKKMIKQIILIIPSLKKAVIWNIEDIKILIVHVENKLSNRVNTPCNFVSFLEELLKKKQTKQNIYFLKYILSDDTRCKRVFRTL